MCAHDLRMPSDKAQAWLEGARDDALLHAEAYRSRLESLRWANLLFMTLPSVLATTAAILAANDGWKIAGVSLAAVLAGAATVLMAVHKACKCDDYQADCLALHNGYASLAIATAFLIARPEKATCEALMDLSQRWQALVQGGRALLLTRHRSSARRWLVSLSQGSRRSPPLGDRS
jgi:hypothetical protein